MFKVMALIQTNGGAITRTVAEVGYLEGALLAEAYWKERSATLLTWIECPSN